MICVSRSRCRGFIPQAGLSLNSEAWPHSLRLLPICPLQGQQKDERKMDGFSGSAALAALIEMYFVRNFKWKWVSVYLSSKPEKRLFFCLQYWSVCLPAFRIEPRWLIQSVIFMALMILLFPDWNYYHQLLLEGLMVKLPIYIQTFSACSSDEASVCRTVPTRLSATRSNTRTNAPTTCQHGVVTGQLMTQQA